MPIYAPLTSIIPTPANGNVVPSAWGDQVDDNLVAHYEGVWFRAIGGAATLVAAAYTVIPMTSIVISATATDEASISIVSGAVTVTKPGIWLVCACAQFGASSTLAGIAIGATNATSTLESESLIDTSGANSLHETSTMVDVTSNPATFTLNCYINSGTPAITVNSFSPRLSGVWLCEHP
jgi:hypothetical protein